MTNYLPRRVGINAIFLLPGMGGLDTYVQELLPALVRAAPSTRIAVYCSPVGEAYLRSADWAGDVAFVSHPLFGTRGLKAVCELTLLGVLAGRQVDLLHSVALTAPLRTGAVNVITIADTTWIKGAAPDATTSLWRAIGPPVARRADRLIAISQIGAEEIAHDLRIDRGRIDVTLLGYRAREGSGALSAAEVRRRFALGEGPIVLTVGTRKPHKNVRGLLVAFAQVLADLPDAHLVLAGNPTAEEPALIDLTQRLGIGDHISFLPFVAADELEGLYRAATCLVLPSFSEGFGLPILEAMGRGVAVACSDASALPEVAGGAALTFNPHRDDEIAAAIVSLLSDQTLRERMAARGTERAAALTWEATARATLESYRRAWNRRR